jgi:hypothetical protein
MVFLEYLIFLSLKNHVIDIVELEYIKKVAIGCVDKTL